MPKETKTKKAIVTKKKTASKKKVVVTPKKKVTAAKKTTTPKKETSLPKKGGKYFEGIGRRKRSRARVRIWVDNSEIFTINEKDSKEYLPTEELATTANAPLRKLKMLQQFKVSAIVYGGGTRGQAEAVRHGLARALVKYDPDLRLSLKKLSTVFFE